MHIIPTYALCITSHIFVLSLLSVRRWQLTNAPDRPLLVPSFSIRLCGSLAAVGTVWLPCLGPDDPFQQCGVRVASLFYALKLLDLALTKADEPPKLRNSNGGDAVPEHVKYVWLLLTEMRYRAFDVEAAHKGRPSARVAHRELASKMLPPVILTGVVYAFPIAETKCLLLLCLIQNGLEGVHTLLHPFCPYVLFYRPFVAATLGDFWTIHWHSSAVFLQSLAYKPVRRLLGRPGGIVAAFALSGVWHAWAAMPLAEEPHAVKLGLQVWIFFMMLGVGTLLERLVWRDKQGGWLQRVLVWTWSLCWAGWCFRTLEHHSMISFLRTA